MTFFSTDNVSKRYGEKILFENLNFGLSKGDKTALVAPNGTGKSTLLRIIAGLDQPDSGKVMIKNGISVALLEQEPQLDNALTINQVIYHGNQQMADCIDAYHKAVHDQATDFNESTQKAFEKASVEMDRLNAWDYEIRLEQILGKLNIHDLTRVTGTLSGGEKKRVALAMCLLDNPDVLLLDEPTNHLDVDMIEWLEGYLQKSTMSLFMITHDRYFLDRVCNVILELESGKLYTHKGNYSFYLQKKQERETVEEVEREKAKQFLKREIEWIRRSPKARTTKSQARVDAFYETQEKFSGKKTQLDLKLDVKTSRLGSKILELHQISKSFDSKSILNPFSYTFSKGERIGILGKNGVGKSTFLKLITGEMLADSGLIETGETIQFGYYKQEHLQFDENKRVIDLAKDTAEYIQLADGNQVSASKFLEFFMFPPSLQYAPIASLSGGEKRRLSLMLVLLKNPNFLILDEPTNDLDLQTMQKLETFLLEYSSCLIIVSHDRFFMDNLVEHYFVFEGNGKIKDYNGSYASYRLEFNQNDSSLKNNDKKTQVEPKSQPEKSKPKKRTYAQQKEFSTLEKQIQQLEDEKAVLEAKLSSGKTTLDEITKASIRIGELLEEIDEKSLRWLKLAELDE